MKLITPVSDAPKPEKVAPMADFGRGETIFPSPFNAHGLFLFADTETDGFGSSEGPPNLVEIGAIVTDDTGAEMAALSAIVKPEGFEVPEAASAVNGITQAHAAEFGVPLWQAVWNFDRLVSMSQMIVFHNRSFDARVINGAYARVGVMSPLPLKAQTCTMIQSINVCCIPNNKKAGLKNPRLDELFFFLFGVERTASHGALVDARDTAKCYFELKKRGQI